MPSIILPLEIEETILDLLAENDEGHSALKTCSLVCQAFLPICRKHIFGSIVLSDKLGSPPSPEPNIYVFDRLLHETPKIADYIRNLSYYFGNAYLLPNPSIQESLKRISRLECLTVWQYDRSNSNLNWRSIRPALLHLLHLPTLTHFEAAGIIEFVVSDLIPCVNLKYLEISPSTTVAAEDTFSATLPEHSIQLNEFVAQIRTSTATMLCIARRPDGHPIIDFGSLSKLTVSFENLSEGEASKELFRRCHALANVNVSFWEPRYVRPSLADMLRPSMQTLKHISVEIHVNDSDDASDHDDPLFDILFEFKDMRTKNVIETITIEILIHMRASCRRLGGDGWSHSVRYSGLDEVLTTPGWFSLKRVSLAMAITVTSWKWHCENCLKRDFHDFYQAIPFHSISRLSPCVPTNTV